MILETRLTGWAYENRVPRYDAIMSGAAPKPARLSLRESVEYDGIEAIGDDGFSYGWIPKQLSKALGAAPLAVLRQTLKEECPKGFTYKTAYAVIDRFDLVGDALTTTVIARVYVTE